jgi:hypothetical protein
LSGKVAIINRGASGIGRGTVEFFAAAAAAKDSLVAGSAPIVQSNSVDSRFPAPR